MRRTSSFAMLKGETTKLGQGLKEGGKTYSDRNQDDERCAPSAQLISTLQTS